VCMCVNRLVQLRQNNNLCIDLINSLSVWFILHYLEEDSDLLEVPGSDSLKLLLDVSEFLEARPPWLDEAPLVSLLLLPRWLLEMRFL